jgi:uncharacterized tellurite resistance protein B-like protein
MTDSITHPLLAYPEAERVAYLSTIAELSNVDSKFDEQERKHLDEQLKAFEISDEGKAKVYAAVFHFKEEHRSEVVASLQALDDSDLRFTLIADLFLLALSNGYISVEELEYVQTIGSQLGITKDQVMAIKDVQFHLWQLRSTPSDSDVFKAMLKECASNLAAAGVPIVAVAGSGSVFGLSAAGITSGLAALGGLIGGGMLAGTVLVVPAIAVGSAWGVKKLVDLVIDKK